MVLLAVGVAITWASRVLLASLALWAPSVQLDVVYGALSCFIHERTGRTASWGQSGSLGWLLAR
jgi:hypothetical protein